MNAIPTSNPSSSDIASAINAATIGTDVSAVKTAIEDTSSGLAALKTLIDTIDTVADGIRSELDSSSHGLDALATGISNNSLTASDVHGFLDSYASKSDFKADVSILVNATHGLAALKALIDTVDTVVDAAKANQEDATSGFSALHALLDAIPTTDAPTTSEIATAISGSEVLTGVDLKRTLRTLLAVLVGGASLNSNQDEVTYSDPGGGTDRAKHTVSDPDGTRTGELL